MSAEERCQGLCFGRLGRVGKCFPTVQCLQSPLLYVFNLPCSSLKTCKQMNTMTAALWKSRHAGVICIFFFTSLSPLFLSFNGPSCFFGLEDCLWFKALFRSPQQQGRSTECIAVDLWLVVTPLPLPNLIGMSCSSEHMTVAAAGRSAQVLHENKRNALQKDHFLTY